MAVVQRRGPRLDRELTKYIVDGEEVIVSVRRHWFSLAREIAYAVIALVVAVVVDVGSPASPGGRFMADVAWALFWAAALWLLWTFLNWRNDFFIATNKRFLLFYGFIRRKVAMMPLIKVTDLTFDRPLVGRLLGYGHFVLESAGQEQALAHIGMIPHADQTYREICSVLFGAGDVDPEDREWHRGDGGSASGPDGGGWGGGGDRPGPEVPGAPQGWVEPTYAARHGHGHDETGAGVTEPTTRHTSEPARSSREESWYRSDQRSRRPMTPDTGEILYVPREWA